MTTAQDMMTTATGSLHHDDSVQRAAHLMTEWGVDVLPVYDRDNRVRGTLTQRDIVLRTLGAGKDPTTTAVQELVHHRHLITLRANDDVTAAMHTMTTHKVRRLPVVDGHELLGMISQADLARALLNPLIADLLAALSTD